MNLAELDIEEDSPWRTQNALASLLQQSPFSWNPTIWHPAAFHNQRGGSQDHHRRKGRGSVKTNNKHPAQQHQDQRDEPFSIHGRLQSVSLQANS
jgi:hypothetical protein